MNVFCTYWRFLFVRFDHPYQTEISEFKYPPFAYKTAEPLKFLPFESTTATFVDTLDGVKSMLAELKTADAIAIDLEHHDAHSYHGIVCLMQISTRNKDWIVDTLKPWREELQILNEVFADPAILKVLHGSSMDIIWLQRDFGLYIVGLFDTYHASVALGYQKKSLKFLLEKFIGLQAEKKYQMADWRVRPLLPAMFDYARSDTHYLLYIFDHLRNELLQNSTETDDLMNYVLEQSRREALQRYERPIYNATTGEGNGGWLNILTRSSVLFSKEQFSVFRAVHQWRDQTARAEDEGVQYVLSNQALFKVAYTMPIDQASLLRTVTYPSPLVRVRASELAQIIKKAKESGANGPELRDFFGKPKEHLNKTDIVPETLSNDDFDSHAVVTRSESSQFWGPAIYNPETVVSPSYTLLASSEASRFSLPMPSVPSKLSESSDMVHHPVSSEHVSEGAPGSLSKPDNFPSNQVFTVKQYGVPKKRKMSPVLSDLPKDVLATGESPSVDDTISQSGSQQTQSKKSQRKKQKSGAENGTKSPADEPDVIPFDYSNAESILHAKSPANSGSHQGPSQKQFNPYAKAMDAPHGMRKAKKTIEGKSFTFRK